MKNNKSAISLLLTILIISSLLASTLTVSSFIVRYLRITKSVELSEMAYYSAESALEKVAYKVFKDYCEIGAGGTCGISGNLSLGPYFEVKSEDITAYTVSSPWSISLDPGKSFNFGLDLNGANYPSSITINRSGNQESELIIIERLKTEKSWSELVFTSSFPFTLNISSNKYYRIRINNKGTGTETYTFSFSGNLPIGLKVNSSLGKYLGYQRKIEAIIPKYFTN